MIEIASVIQAFCVAAKAVKKTGEKVSEIVDTYNKVKSSLVEKDETLKPIVQDLEKEPEDEFTKGYLEKKLRASPAMESSEIQALLKQFTETVEKSQPQPSNSQSASNIQGKVIQIQSGDNATFHNIS